MDALLVLTNIAIILLLGILCSLLSKKLRIPNVLFLVVLGIILGRVSYNQQPLFIFDSSFLVGIGSLALVMIVFDGASRFRFRELDTFSLSSFKIIGYFILFSIILLTFFTVFLFFSELSVINILFAVMFAVIVIETDPGSVFTMLREYISDKTKKTLDVLEIEAVMNTPIVLVLSFVLLDLIKNLMQGQGDFVSSFISQIPVLLAQIVVGVGAGMVVGLIVFKTMQKAYSHEFSPVAIITAALLSYILAENLNGNGVLSVATLGLLFGNIYVKEKFQLQEFSYMLTNALEILVFVLVGLMIRIPLTNEFIVNSLFLFSLLVLARLGAVFVTLNKKDYSFREKLFMSLVMPKGIAVAVIVFTFSLSYYQQMSVILNLLLAIIIYSLLLATVMEKLSGLFLEKIPPKIEETSVSKIRSQKKKLAGQNSP